MGPHLLSIHDLNHLIPTMVPVLLVGYTVLNCAVLIVIAMEFATLYVTGKSIGCTLHRAIMWWFYGYENTNTAGTIDYPLRLAGHWNWNSYFREIKWEIIIILRWRKGCLNNLQGALYLRWALRSVKTTGLPVELVHVLSTRLTLRGLIQER